MIRCTLTFWLQNELFNYKLFHAGNNCFSVRLHLIARVSSLMRKAQEALIQTAVSRDTRKFRGVRGHARPGKFFILRLLKSQEIYSKLSNIVKSYQFIPVKNTCYQRYKLLSIQYLLQLTSKIGTIDKMFGCCRGQKTICS